MDLERPTVNVAAKVLRIGREHHGPCGPLVTVEWPYTGISEPPDIRELHSPRLYLDDVLSALWRVRNREEYITDSDIVSARSTTPVHAGRSIEQTAP